MLKITGRLSLPNSANLGVYKRNAYSLFSFASTLTVISVLLGLKWVFCIYSLYYVFMCKKISLHYQRTAENQNIVAKLKGLEKVFYPHILWMFPQIQTIAYVVRNIPKNAYREVEIEQDDGGSFFVHIYEPVESPKHMVVLVHGLGGSAHSKHVTIICNHFLREGHRVLIMSARGTLHKLKTPVFFHIGWTKDLVRTMKYALETYSGTLSGVGYSLGGHWMAKVFGEISDHFSTDECARIKGAMAISIPFDFVKIAEYMKRPIPKRMYNRVFATKIHKFVARNREVYEAAGFPIDQIMAARTMHELDQLLTLRVFMINDISEHYYQQSCVRVISKINKPFLILNSKDDPIVPLSTIPIKECLKSTHVILALTERGGHMGFLGYCNYMTYAEEAAIEFTRAIIDLE
ncbi:abhydrolase domain-containing protein 1/3 [Nematocida homosporus]|uniref:abhydrolase domain-containing protein 1/3 n=1 Tax=Nematocida homosporus TaxID=1912981 RepID=UPI00221EF2CC|nr:abhydrolase domain-containing protein 1/3 [Nematocida homosporus]KAI5187065.1 abhydrolase domain-containing protein 1/3 [Nematocida homosporus]